MKEDAPNELLGTQNTNERMADRPAAATANLDPSGLTPLTVAVDDTALQSGDAPVVDDV